MAEYEACIAGLEVALDMNLKIWKFMKIISWIISQSIVEWGVKSLKLANIRGT